MSVIKLPPYPEGMMILISREREFNGHRMTSINEQLCTNWKLLMEHIWLKLYQNAYKVFFDLNSVKPNTHFIKLENCNNDRIEWLNQIMKYIAESIAIDVTRSSNREGHKLTSRLEIYYQYDEETFPEHSILILQERIDLDIFFSKEQMPDYMWDPIPKPPTLEEHTPEDWNALETERKASSYLAW